MYLDPLKKRLYKTPENVDRYVLPNLGGKVNIDAVCSSLKAPQTHDVPLKTGPIDKYLFFFFRDFP